MESALQRQTGQIRLDEGYLCVKEAGGLLRQFASRTIHSVLVKMVECGTSYVLHARLKGHLRCKIIELGDSMHYALITQLVPINTTKPAKTRHGRMVGSRVCAHPAGVASCMQSMPGSMVRMHTFTFPMDPNGYSQCGDTQNDQGVKDGFPWGLCRFV